MAQKELSEIVNQKNCIQTVKGLELIKLWLNSTLFVLLMYIKRIPAVIGNLLWPEVKKELSDILLDQPPPCLVDNSLGNHSYIKVKGTKLHYLEAGLRHKPLLILLHGFPDCWISWRKQILVLSEKFWVIAFDLKGFGESDKPQWRGNYNIQCQLKELRAFLSAVKAERCTIMGHDLGGQLAWYFAAKYPKIVSKLVIVSTVHPNVFWEYHVDPYDQLLKFCIIPKIPEMEAQRSGLLKKSFKHVTPELLLAYNYTLSRSMDWTGAIHQLRSLSRHRLHTESKLNIPTLLISGNSDSSVPLHAIVKSTEFLTDNQLRLLAGGHFVHQENPDEFNKVVLKFLKADGQDEEQLKMQMDESSGFLGNLVKNSVIKYASSPYLTAVWRSQSLKL